MMAHGGLGVLSMMIWCVMTIQQFSAHHEVSDPEQSLAISEMAESRSQIAF
jgi:hypothetical protein